jgi:hypothetical protein
VFNDEFGNGNSVQQPQGKQAGDHTAHEEVTIQYAWPFHTNSLTCLQVPRYV